MTSEMLQKKILEYVKTHPKGVTILEIADEIAPFLKAHRTEALNETRKLLEQLEMKELIEKKYFPGPLSEYSE